jgi:hypothetical protein
LDAIAAYGRNKLFVELGMHIFRKKGFLGRITHGDNSSTFPLYEEYPETNKITF